MDDANLAFGDGPQPRIEHVPADAAGLDLPRAMRHRPEGQKEIGVLGDRVECRAVGGGAVVGAQHVAQQDRARRLAVAILVAGVAADLVHQAFDETLAVMQPAGAGPAIGTRKDRIIGMRLADAVDLAGRQPERDIPGHRHVAIAPPRRAVAAQTVAQPALAHVGLVDAHGRIEPVLQRIQHRRRRRVFFEGFDADELAVLDQRRERTPMGAMWNALHRQSSILN